MKNEIWRPTEDEGYDVSTEGRVKNSKTGRILKPWKSGKYVCITMVKNRAKTAKYIHRLVAFAFPEICGEWFEGAECNHKDENTLNNEAWNLEWVTHKTNCNYGSRNERAAEKKRGIKLGKMSAEHSGKIAAALSIPVYQYDLNWHFIREWQSATEAARNGYNRAHIRECCVGQRNKHKECRWTFKPVE